LYTIYLFSCVACFWSLPLGVEDFENLQELDVQDFKLQLAGEQGKWPLTILIICALFHTLVYTLVCMLYILLPKPHTVGFGFILG
jgi:hypothetical protein